MLCSSSSISLGTRPRKACAFQRRGECYDALWNTLVLAARVETLWEAGWLCFPEMMPLFERYVEVVGASKARNVLGNIYEIMPAWNFSSHLLERLPELGISIDNVTRQLEDEGVEKFNQPFDKLMETLAQRSPRHLAGESWE